MANDFAREKRAMDQAAKDLATRRQDLKKALDKCKELHGKIAPRNEKTPTDKGLKGWNSDMQKANKALNEVAKQMQKLANATNAFHQARIQAASKAAAQG